MPACLYCAQTRTRKDEFGYCRKYSCKFRAELEKPKQVKQHDPWPARFRQLALRYYGSTNINLVKF